MIPWSLYSISNKYLMQYIAQRIIVFKNCNVPSETSICIGYRVRGKDRYQESMMSNRRCECRELSLSLPVSGSRIRFIWQNDTQRQVVRVRGRPETRPTGRNGVSWGPGPWPWRAEHLGRVGPASLRHLTSPYNRQWSLSRSSWIVLLKDTG